jgi:CDP-6-deoxy-D-xylo-4-hexulose-3-dehydrase
LDYRYPLATSTWDSAEIRAMHDVIASGRFTMGSRVEAFESSFSKQFQTNHAVMSNSGSSANLLALSAIRFSSLNPSRERDEVIVPAVSWSTTYYPVSQLGFKLRFVDIDIETLNASPDAIEAAIGSRTAGILAVNLLGNPSKLKEIRELANRYSLFLIEDNCESMGAEYEGKLAGTFGDVGTYSSFFSHHISTMEGGVSVTNSLELKQVMTSLRAHGWTRELPPTNLIHNKTGDEFDDSFRFVLPGYNLRPLEIEAAIGEQQLLKLPGIIEGRRLNAEKFRKVMENFPEFTIQFEIGKSSWFGFSIILGERFSGRRKDLIETLNKFSIAVRPIVAGNFTRNPVMKHLPHVEIGDLPCADRVHSDGLFIGNHHYEMNEEFDILHDAITAFVNR